jgi:hypothetical protein
MSTLTVPSPAKATPPRESTFEERWSAWESRGREHDRIVSRRMRTAMLVLVALVGIALFWGGFR